MPWPGCFSPPPLTSKVMTGEGETRTLLIFIRDRAAFPTYNLILLFLSFLFLALKNECPLTRLLRQPEDAPPCPPASLLPPLRAGGIAEIPSPFFQLPSPPPLPQDYRGKWTHTKAS